MWALEGAVKGARESRREKMTLPEVVGEDLIEGEKPFELKMRWSSPGKEGKLQYGQSRGCGHLLRENE